MLENFSTSREMQYQKLSLEEQQQRGILGRLVGIMADCKHPTRNGRLYTEELWDKTFADPIMKEKIANRCLFGELGHPEDRQEIDMEKICICLAETPKKGDDGKIYGVFDILNTPNGRILNALCQYGCQIGVSSRGSGDVVEDFDGNETVEPDTYECECWDAVLLPAVKEARPRYVNESLETNKKTLKVALREELERSTEDEKKVMEQTLNELKIDYSEDAKLDEAKTYTSEDNVTPVTDERVLNLFSGKDMLSVYEDMSKDISKYFEIGDLFKFTDSTVHKNRLPGTTIKVIDVVAVQGHEDVYVVFDWTTDKGTTISRMSIDQFVSMLNNSTYELVEKVIAPEKVDYIETAESNETQNEAAEDNGAEMIRELQEAIKVQAEQEKQIKTLQEKLSVCYTKEARYSETLSRTKQELAHAKTENSNLTEQLKTANEQLGVLKTSASEKEVVVMSQQKKIKVLTERLDEGKNNRESLTEAISKKDHQIKSLQEQVSSLTESHKQQCAKLEEEKKTLAESLADSKKDNQILKSQSTAKITRAQQLVEKYQAIAKTAIDKYIGSQARRLGVKSEEIKQKLSENYSFNDIDRVCEELQRYKLNVNSLPFNMTAEKKPVRMTIKESKEVIGADNDYSADDEIDSTLRGFI